MSVTILGIIILSAVLLLPYLFAKWTDEPLTRVMFTLIFAVAFSAFAYYTYHDVTYPETILKDCKECPGSSFWNMERLYSWVILCAAWLWLSTVYFSVSDYIVRD